MVRSLKHSQKKYHNALTTSLKFQLKTWHGDKDKILLSDSKEVTKK
jgi:hypothetical protein